MMSPDLATEAIPGSTLLATGQLSGPETLARRARDPRRRISTEMGQAEAVTCATRSNCQDSTVASDASGTISPLTCWSTCSGMKLRPYNS